MRRVHYVGCCVLCMHLACAGDSVSRSASRVAPESEHEVREAGSRWLPEDAEVVWPGDQRLCMSDDPHVVRLYMSLYPSAYREMEYGDRPSVSTTFPLLKLFWKFIDAQEIDQIGYALIVEGATRGSEQTRRMVIVGAVDQASFSVMASAPYEVDGWPTDWELTGETWSPAATQDVLDAPFASTCAGPSRGAPGIYEVLVARLDGVYRIRLRVDLAQANPVSLLDATRVSAAPPAAEGL